jgi:hypothetical protein
MDPKTFLELTESQLLTETGEMLRGFFSKELVEYKPTSTEGTYEKVTRPNPRTSIYPMAQINMISNVIFHIMAQQLAILFYERPNISRQEVFETTSDNIRRLVVKYLKDIKEGKEEEEKAKNEATPEAIAPVCTLDESVDISKVVEGAIEPTETEEPLMYDGKM